MDSEEKLRERTLFHSDIIFHKGCQVCEQEAHKPWQQIYSYFSGGLRVALPETLDFLTHISLLI